jgi:hypothetical protein
MDRIDRLDVSCTLDPDGYDSELALQEGFSACLGQERETRQSEMPRHAIHISFSQSERVLIFVGVENAESSSNEKTEE